MTTVLTEGSRPDEGRRNVPLPGGRAMLGAVLVVLAGAGVLAAHRAATAPATHRWTVVTRDVPAGTVLTSDDLGTVAAEMPTGSPAVPASRARSLIGGLTVAPLAEMSLVRPGDVRDPADAAAAGSVEVPVEIERSRDLGDSIHQGSLVDVLSTDPELDGTVVLARAVKVLDVGRSEGGGIGDGSTVRYRLALPDADSAVAVVDASVRSQLTLVVPTGGRSDG